MPSKSKYLTVVNT